MAGLLGEGWDDPQSQMIMGLAQGLLSARGGAGLAAGIGGMQAAQQNGMKNKLIGAQLDNYRSEIEARKLAGVKDARNQEEFSRFFGGGDSTAPAQPGQIGSGSFGAVPLQPGMDTMPQGAGRGGIGSKSLDEVARFSMLTGKDLLPAWKIAQEGFKRDPGSFVDSATGGPRQYIPKVGEGVAPNANGVYSALPGYPEALARIEGAKTGAVEGAKAGFDLVKVVGQDGAERYVPRSTVVGSAQPVAPRPMSQPRGMASAPGESDRFAILSQELQKARTAGNAADVAGLEREIARLPVAERPGVSASGLAVPGFQATPTTAQKLSGDAGGKINESWLKTSYEPVIASIGPVNETLASVKVARNAIDKMGGTGWGTETKATAANVLAGLGISSGNAKMLATNSQVFQNAAMERLQSVLNQATGPQTDQDATRASKTFAGLANTTEANKFILDMAEAKAQRDKMKADFYQKALPIAQQKGNLQEIDREWAARAPSIFNMPSMTAWGIK